MVEKILNTSARTRLEVAALQRTISLFWETLLVSTNSRVLTAVFPVLHGVKLYGVEQMRVQMGLFWVALQGFLYILGAGLYAVRNPTLGPR